MTNQMNKINNAQSNTKEPTQNHAPKKDGSFPLRDLTQIVYICQILSFLFGISAIIGVVINYLKRDAVKGSWLESHFDWQLRTFWFGLLFGVIGILLAIAVIGFLILAANLVWIIYRVTKGWLLLREEKPIEESSALL